MEQSEETEREESVKTKVLKAIEERGFSLELQTYLELRNQGWLASMQSIFTNVQTEKQDKSFLEGLRDLWNAPAEPIYRTIDVSALKGIASKHPLIRNATIGLIIECKYRKKEHWVFYTESMDSNQSLQVVKVGLQQTGVSDIETALGWLSFGELSSFGNSIRKDIQKQMDQEIVKNIRRTSHHSITKLNELALSHSSVFTSKTGNIYDACQQVLGAAIYFAKSNPEQIAKMLTESKPINYWRLYPIVVFSGPMWSISFDAQQEKHLEPLKWTTYMYPYKGNWFSVDIVSLSSLNEYLEILNTEIASLGKCFLNED